MPPALTQSKLSFFAKPSSSTPGPAPPPNNGENEPVQHSSSSKCSSKSIDTAVGKAPAPPNEPDDFSPAVSKPAGAGPFSSSKKKANPFKPPPPPAEPDSSDDDFQAPAAKVAA